jgi:alpha-glucosidase (family GH31 glycosyl hydrolase)
MTHKYALLLLLAVVMCLPACKKDKDKGTEVIPLDVKYNTPWPAWVFQHWVWEDEGTGASARQIVDDYLANDIPVGAIIIDSPWETGYNTFSFDSSLYPDPQGMVNYFHGKNVKVMMWATGVINIDQQPEYNYAKQNNYFMRVSATDTVGVIKWWKGKGSLIDWWNPQAVAWWKGLMDKTLQYGIDGWKVDGTDFYALSSPYSPGLGSNVSRIDYSAKYYRLFQDYTRQKLGGKQVITARPIDNYGFTGAGGSQLALAPVDMNYCGWVGDQDATFTGLTKALNNMYYSSVEGYLAYGSDIGGYREDNTAPPQMRTRELFIRWAQLGAFCPVMENGGGGEHRPWKFDAQTLEIYRKVAKMHHQLTDYFMRNSMAYYNTKKSLMSVFNKTDYSYLLGPDIFVAPVLSQGNAGVSTVTISFPAGSTWVYLYDKTQEFEGGTSVTKDFTLEQYPVFIKKDAAVLNELSVL